MPLYPDKKPPMSFGSSKESAALTELMKSLTRDQRSSIHTIYEKFCKNSKVLDMTTLFCNERERILQLLYNDSINKINKIAISSPNWRIVIDAKSLLKCCVKQKYQEDLKLIQYYKKLKTKLPALIEEQYQLSRRLQDIGFEIRRNIQFRS